jgi:carbamoyltransferase
MSRAFGVYGPSHPWLGSLGHHLGRFLKSLYPSPKFYRARDGYARQQAASLQTKLKAGQPVYLLGIGPGGHNAGIALVEVSSEHGVRLICNNEEERFSGVRHDTRYPQLAIEALMAQMQAMSIEPAQVHACLASWDYVRLPASIMQLFLEELPRSVTYLNPAAKPAVLNMSQVFDAYRAPGRLASQLGLPHPLPVIGMRHHDNHAYFSWAVSPFAGCSDPVIVTVLDGMGDDAAMSLYVGNKERLQLLRSNHIYDSLGFFYSILSSTQGGWTILSSEGRYMGAAAWGQNDRLTNPYYRQLRQLFYFDKDGQVHLNRTLANWPRGLELKPYSPGLAALIGPPIPLHKMWNPDAVLRPDDVQHAEITQQRLDKAAATQMVFEDVLFHVIGHLIRTTGSNKLVLTGGTALNALANMRLLEHFDEAFYERYLGRKETRLHIWVPPTPGDTGVTMGAAYHFALANGAALGDRLQHAFYCGPAPTTGEIRAALDTAAEIRWVPLGDVSQPEGRDQVADLLAYIVSRDGVVGLFQGPAETGPRALGHRSILANPCNPRTRETLNSLVKFREKVRPLAPMATSAAARRWFELSPGASDDDYNAYNYMTLTAPARPESRSTIPAVVHEDGTSRVQIVRQETDPLTYAYLEAMGRRLGVEVSVNTSLNVGGPIVQTPQQALETLKRSKGMDGLVLAGAEGDAFLAWHDVQAAPKDPSRLHGWVRAWQEEIGVGLAGAGRPWPS